MVIGSSEKDDIYSPDAGSDPELGLGAEIKVPETKAPETKAPETKVPSITNDYSHNHNKNNNHHYYYSPHTVKGALNNNEPLDEFLHVISVISNPCNYRRRYQLAKEFTNRMRTEKSIKFYIVELVYTYSPNKFTLTNKDDPFHLQIKTDTPWLWHKENMINIGVNKLLPKDWKAFAYVDMDIEFENVHWAKDTLKLLNGVFDVVQPFSHAIDMDQNMDAMTHVSSASFQYFRKREYLMTPPPKQCHPGYCLAMTRKAYIQIGGLFEYSILGSGDHNMIMSFLGMGYRSYNSAVSSGYKKFVHQFEERATGLRLGYTPGVISHYFHGQKVKRFYNSRWEILIKSSFDPELHLDKTEIGLLIPSKDCPKQLLIDIADYFRSRDEDEFTK